MLKIIIKFFIFLFWLSHTRVDKLLYKIYPNPPKKIENVVWIRSKFNKYNMIFENDVWLEKVKLMRKVRKEFEVIVRL